jgi:hypothetical protein
MAKEIRRIEKEFVFKHVIDRELPVEVHAETQRLAFRLIEAGERELNLSTLGDEPVKVEEGMPVAVFFRFRGQVMTFQSTVKRLSADGIVLATPERLYRDLSRDFERIMAPEGIRVSLVVEGYDVQLDYPASASYDPAEPPEYEPGFDATQITKLLKSFRERASRFAIENKIVMFRERTPRVLPEILLSRSGKIVILPFLGEALSQYSSEARHRILTQDDAVSIFSEEGRESFTSLTEISHFVQEKRQAGIHGELYCPLLYGKYVVGYLYLIRGKEGGNAFSEEALSFVMSFSRILVYSLKTNGYFKKDEKESEYGASELINISGSGLLFSYPTDGPELRLYAPVELRIKLDDRVIPAKGRVMRKFEDSGHLYFGVQFLEIETSDMELLFDRIYGEMYRGEADSIGLAEIDDPEEDDYSNQ